MAHAEGGNHYDETTATATCSATWGPPIAFSYRGCTRVAQRSDVDVVLYVEFAIETRG